MGMFSLWKCPRCWDNPCHCKTDAHGDPVLSNSSIPMPRVDNNKREIELLEEQNRLLKEIRNKLPQ